jgi:hypothetical protein|tara:strand:+ start:727 stop:1482 length:756 start_codon:yes stop_codon:yes gene_type:complete
MIRNYYTEAFKSGIVPVVSATQLIDGTVKITQSTTATSVVNTATSTTLVLTLNLAIKQGMYITCPTMAPVISINDHLMVANVVHGANTTVTLSTATVMQAGQALTFFNVNQNSWNEYSLYIGTSPEQGNNFGSITSGTGNLALAAQNTITIKVSNAYVQAGMSVYDDGALVGVIATVTNSTTFVLVAPLAANIVDASILTFAFTVLPSISVLTIDNQTVTFTNPAQGFVLPVSVVQVTAVAGGLSNLIAVN